MEYTKKRAVEAAKNLERFCLYYRLEKNDCQGCPFTHGAACLLHEPMSWASLTKKYKNNRNTVESALYAF